MANDPAAAGKRLGDAPSVHRTASVRATTFGRWCEVGARTKVAESSFGDYSYVVNDSDIIYVDDWQVLLDCGAHKTEPRQPSA